MAGKERLLRADSDGWGVSAAVGLVLSIRCISLVPLPFKEHQQARHNSAAKQGGTQHWSALIKVCAWRGE